MKCYEIILKARQYCSKQTGHLFAGWKTYALEDDPMLTFYQTHGAFAVKAVRKPPWFIEKAVRKLSEETQTGVLNDQPLDALTLSPQTLQVLNDADVTCIGDLLECGLDNLTSINGLGDGRASEIADAVAVLATEMDVEL